MARVKFGDGVSGQTGSLNKSAGGVTYLKNNVKRMRVVGTNPRSESQSITRNAFAFLTSAWAGLSDGQRQAWEDARNDPYFYVSDNFYGVPRKVNSGKSLFIQVNYNLLETLDDVKTPSVVTTDPALNEPGDDIGVTGVAADASANTFIITYSGTLNKEVLIVRTTGPVSQGVMRLTSVAPQLRTALNKVSAVSPATVAGRLGGSFTGQDGKKCFYEIYGVNITSGKKRPIATGSTVIVA